MHHQYKLRDQVTFFLSIITSDRTLFIMVESVRWKVLLHGTFLCTSFFFYLIYVKHFSFNDRYPQLQWA